MYVFNLNFVFAMESTGAKSYITVNNHVPIMVSKLQCGAIEIIRPPSNGRDPHDQVFVDHRNRIAVTGDTPKPFPRFFTPNLRGPINLERSGI